MERSPIIVGRVPIQITDDSFYPVYKFEGVYEIDLYGTIRRVSDNKEVKVFGSDVVLRHPDGDGSSLCCRVIDVWSSTFLGDKALDKYSYVKAIKHKR